MFLIELFYKAGNDFTDIHSVVILCRIAGGVDCFVKEAFGLYILKSKLFAKKNDFSLLKADRAADTAGCKSRFLCFVHIASAESSAVGESFLVFIGEDAYGKIILPFDKFIGVSLRPYKAEAYILVP